MRIRFKLTAAFLAIASLVAAAGYLAQRTGHEVQQQIQRLSDRGLRRTAAATHISLALYADHLTAHRLIADRRRQAGATAPARMQASETVLSPPQPHPLPTPPGEEFPTDWTGEHGRADLSRLEGSDLSSLTGLQKGLTEHQRRLSEFCRLLEEDADRAELFLLEEVCPHFSHTLLPELNAIRDQAEQESTSGIRRAERALASADTRRGLLMVAAAAAAVSVGLFMSRSIGKPLTVIRRAAQDVGRGRLETRVAVTSRDEIGDLAVALNQMASDLQQQTVSTDYLDNIIRSMRDIMIVTDADLRIQRVNPAALAELKYTAAELSGRPLGQLFVSEIAFDSVEPSMERADGVEVVMRTRSDDRIPVHCSLAPMRDPTGQVTGVVCVAANISQQKETERRLRDSLREKELLLKEVHHRVKNNLQVISSLLNLQADQFQDPELVRVFRESQARVRSMALIHQQLYRSDDLARIDFAAYIIELTEHLKRGLGSDAARVNVALDLHSILLPIDLAIPCGMIVNELISNCLTHAFPDQRAGEIRVSFRSECGRCQLSVADDGVGMPVSPLTGEVTSMGLKVVMALTRQIRGQLECELQRGSEFSVRFECPDDSCCTRPAK
jgi:PAS domain S-box-containing protein